MENLLGVFDLFFENLSKIKGALKSVALRSSLAENEAICLLVMHRFSNPADFFDESLLISLKEKKLIEENLTLTGKGAILAKSLSQALEKEKILNKM